MPDGVRRSLNVPWGLTTVWPALSPPEKRTTYLAFSDSISTILPLPSSPHWAPITATTGIFYLLSQNPYILPSRGRIVHRYFMFDLTPCIPLSVNGEGEGKKRG